jgi:cyclomaltodextrinase / maltogenic alpha-amylase / neopullulanase
MRSVYFLRTQFCSLSILLCFALIAPCRGEKNFSTETARPAPQWLREGVVYEIFTRNFSTSGNFAAITEQLDSLHELGVTVLWLMPIHPAGKERSKGTFGSPYAVRDYYEIDPSYGTKDDFKKLITAAHGSGMKVIIDIVANHTSWDSVMMKNPEFYKTNSSGKIIPPVADWFDVAQLDYGSPKLREYMIAMLKYWLQEFDLDGFRCDVAHMMPVDFWEQARIELSKVKPDIMLLAEASEPALLVKAFDIDYAWPFHAELNRVLIEGAPATEFKKSWDASHARFPKGSLHLRISDNHDEARAVARFGIKGALAASVLMFSLDGVPLLYNGMEVGDATESGAPALFEKLPIFWEPKERPPLRKIYQDLIQLRKAHPAFRNDRVIWLKNSDEANTVTFMRLDQNEEFVVVINFSNRPMVGKVEVLNSGEFKQIFPGNGEVSQELPLFSLNGFEYRIYQRQVPRAK